METAPTNNKRFSDRTMMWAFWLAAVATACAHMTTEDPDLWGHVLYGLEHLERGELSRTDPYSYTAAGATWTNHEWLCELVWAIAWKHAGTVGLWLTRVVLVGGMLAVVMKLILHTTRGLWPGIVLFVLCDSAMEIGFSIRPQLFTFVGVAVLVFVIQRVYSTKHWPIGWSMLFAPIMGLWANLHGGFLIGLGMLTVLSIEQCVLSVRGEVTGRRLPITLLAVGAGIAATLVNPEGTGLYQWLYAALSASRGSLVTEWGSVLTFEPQFQLAGYYAMLPLVIYCFVRSKLKPNWFEWAMLFITAVAAWFQVRHVVIFCLLAAAYLPKHIESAFPRIARLPGFPPIMIKTLIASSVAYAIGVHTLETHRPTAIVIETQAQPYNTFKFIHDHELRGNMVVWFNWAQASMWYLHDRCNVAFDGRFRTVYPASVEKDYFRFHGVWEGWANILDSYDTHMVLMSTNWDGLDRMKGRDDWLLVYRSPDPEPNAEDPDAYEHAVLFVKRGRFADLEARLQRGEIVQPAARATFQFGEPL